MPNAARDLRGRRLAWFGVDRLVRLTPVSGAPRDALLVRPDAHLA